MKIVFFDGYCTLCNGFIDWLMAHDREKKLHFASLQGETAHRLLPVSMTKDLPSQEPDSLVYLQDAVLWDRSTAVLHIFRDLGGAWSGMIVFSLLPGWLRDFFYRFIARHRYQLFSKRDRCRIPTLEERERFLP